MQFTDAVTRAVVALGVAETDLLGIDVLQGSVVARLDLAGSAAMVRAWNRLLCTSPNIIFPH